MGFFNWFSAKPAPLPSGSSQTDIHATLADATRPFLSASSKAGAKQTSQSTSEAVSVQRVEQRRTERNARRELLFQVVRETMVRVGVLSSAFKFKVLALDQRGRTFLVMIDLSTEFAGETDKLAEIEALIAQTAKTRYELAVQAVYWRFYDTVASGSVAPRASATSSPMITASAAARPPAGGLRPTPAQPAAQQPVRAPLQAPGYAGVDPVEYDEVEAFKRALASGSQPGMAIPLKAQMPVNAALPKATPQPASRPIPVPASASASASALAAAAAAKAAAQTATRNKLLLTGYEDTEMPESSEPAPVLSATQYGELR